MVYNKELILQNFDGQPSQISHLVQVHDTAPTSNTCVVDAIKEFPARSMVREEDLSSLVSFFLILVI